MKAGTIPFPREFTVGDAGIDCRAVKGALAAALGGPHGMSVKTNLFARTAGANLAGWKLSVGLLHTPEYTQEAHQHLLPFFTPAEAALMARKALQLAGARQRASYVDAWRWAILHRSLNDYRETRPIPFWLAPFETSERIETDCSGETALLARWEGLPDPSGLAFDGQGNTGTLLAHCVEITQAQAQPADLIVYRDSLADRYGHHVVAILSCHPGNTDFECGSNGKQGDPVDVLHSVELASQARNGHGVATFLRWLPAQ